jgi:3-oxoacyl-[acyl-carrier protein] reductase
MKRALITGGSGIIGAAICRLLAAAGIEVIIHAHSHADQAERLASEINASGACADTCCFDIADPVETGRALEPILAAGPVQILVHNAGIHNDAPMAGMRVEQWHEVIDVSLHGFFHVTQPLLLPMMSTRWGRIVAVSSLAGQMGNRGQTNYAAAKAGLHGAARALALELAPRGVTVNVVAPGIIESPMANASFSDAQIKQLVPMRRAGTPEEVARLIEFLVSDHAAYISAQVIGINGGIL